MKKLAILFFGVFALSTSAQAVTWDFTLEGNTSEEGYASFVTGVDSKSVMATGLTITATKVGDPTAFAYMDRKTAGGPGGLGVCGNLDGNDQCDPASDDNQKAGENVILDFDGKKTVREMIFTGDHGDVDPGTMLFISIDGGAFGAGIDISLLPKVGHLSLLALNVMASNLEYTVTGTGGPDGGVYLSALTAVPLPAAVWLFGTAMLGLFGMRRKTKMEALAA